MSKGTFVYVREQLLLLEVFICVCKRDLGICKRDLYTRQKRPTNISKETNVYVNSSSWKSLHIQKKIQKKITKKNPSVFQTVLKQVLLEVFICACKRDLHIHKRDLHILQKRRKKKSQETCAYVKPQLLKVLEYIFVRKRVLWRGGGLGSRPKKMYGERLGDGVEYHLMKPTPRR